MENQLRLAERRGLLQGRSLSPVAEIGLEILYYADNREKENRDVDEVKWALIANDAARLRKLYPHWFIDDPDTGSDGTRIVYDGTPEAEHVRAHEGYTEDYSEVKWITPSDEEFAEMMKVAEAVAASSTITMNTDKDGGWVS